MYLLQSSEALIDPVLFSFAPLCADVQQETLLSLCGHSQPAPVGLSGCISSTPPTTKVKHPAAQHEKSMNNEQQLRLGRCETKRLHDTREVSTTAEKQTDTLAVNLKPPA